MRIRNTVGKTGVAILALASQLFAGGPFTLLIGNPEASPEAQKMNAVLTVRSGGVLRSGQVRSDRLRHRRGKRRAANDSSEDGSLVRAGYVRNRPAVA